jgi:DNA-binding transcriptional MerR regulator
MNSDIGSIMVVMPSSDPESSAAREFTIDELAAETGVPSRTIRFYQSKKALPAPERRGRKAVYGQEHVERLLLIARLQDQGLTIKAIRAVLIRTDKGELELTDWLGLKNQMQTPWADDAPVLLGKAELVELVGSDQPGLIAELVRLGMVERSSDRFSVRSPALLRVTMRLQQAGVDVATSAEAAKMLRRHLSKAAAEVSKHFLGHLAKAGADAVTTERVTATFDALRPVGLEAVQLIFAKEMERALRNALDAGQTAQVVARS